MNPAITQPHQAKGSAASGGAAGAAGELDFSLVVGGPAYRLMCRARISDAAMRLVQRRMLLAVLIMWAPLLILSALQGALIGPGLTIPFLSDISVQLRFLVVAPLLILAELVVHRRLQPVVAQFRARDLVRPHDVARFEGALDEAVRWRNSAVPEAVLIVAVYAAGFAFGLRRHVGLGAGDWYASPNAAGGLSLAGLWLVFVSLPLLEFLLLRWYFRLFIWARLLWRVSRLDLDLNAIHPDRTGGLGFLAESLIVFALLALAHGVLFAGVLADRIFHGGAQLTDFQMEVFGGGIFLIVVFAGPLMVFTPRLAQVKRDGLREYGALAQTYVRGFHDKWMSGRPPADEPLLGTGDIQSLADLGNSYAWGERMRLVPMKITAVIIFLGAFVAPILPLVFTMVPVEQLLARALKLVF